MSWQVKALVEATPISGPAWVRMVPLASRVIIEPTTLQIASVFEPFCLASRWAASVSAVSPDWLMQMTSVRSSTIGIAVAEFAAVVDFDGNARQSLDHEFAGKSGVPACAAGDDLDVAEIAEFLFADVDFVQEDVAGVERDAARTWCRGRRAAARRFPFA